MAVWTADQLAEFLGSVSDDPLFAFYWLAGLRGLRRSELCGRGGATSTSTAPS